MLDDPRLRSDFFAFLAARFSLRLLPGFFVCPEGGALDPMNERIRRSERLRIDRRRRARRVADAPADGPVE